MDGYQSISQENPLSALSNKGFLAVAENRPFPPGTKDDVWIIKVFGSGENPVGETGNVFRVHTGDILICTSDNPGGNNIDGWILVPRSPDFVEEFNEEIPEP